MIKLEYAASESSLTDFLNATIAKLLEGAKRQKKTLVPQFQKEPERLIFMNEEQTVYLERE